MIYRWTGQRLRTQTKSDKKRNGVTVIQNKGKQLEERSTRYMDRGSSRSNKRWTARERV